ncbi:MAG: L,D-transpeptidase [Pyrinomonadaceae bacterium]|nr:L,D-transpeptidase [Pyrinomonadaceae bacterium]
MKKAVLISIGCIFVLGMIYIITAQSNGRRILPSPEKVFDSMQEKDSQPLPTLKNPLIVVKKKERKLYLYDEEKLVKIYDIALGFAPVGDKEIQGDGKTPEGEFYIFTKNPKSNFYLSLGVSYPSIDDATRGLREKIISKKERDQIVSAINEKKTPLQNTKLGGEIYIHGGGAANDWTLGCVALANEDIKELFNGLTVGTKVKIEP